MIEKCREQLQQVEIFGRYEIDHAMLEILSNICSLLSMYYIYNMKIQEII